MEAWTGRWRSWDLNVELAARCHGPPRPQMARRGCPLSTLWLLALVRDPCLGGGLDTWIISLPQDEYFMESLGLKTRKISCPQESSSQLCGRKVT